MGWNIFKRSPADASGSEVTQGMVLKDTWQTETQIGKGAFGAVWLGVNKKTGEKVAIKFESTDVKMGQLLIEYNLYFRLRKSEHIPKIYDGDQYQHKWHYIVMECMSVSLEKLFNNANHHFSKKTVMQLMIEMLNVMEEIHDMGVIHR
jgi:serine/threonine protein kinase